jgi:hypothetical protein
VCHALLQDPNFLTLLVRIDHELAAQCRANSCPCGGVLHRADYPRKHVFLLDDDGDVQAIPHALYVALATGQASAAALAGQTLRLADWYVRLKEGEPDTVVNETYDLLPLDAQGRVEASHAPVTPASHTHTGVATVFGNEIWPTDSERERMQALLFGGDADGDDRCAASVVS